MKLKSHYLLIILSLVFLSKKINAQESEIIFDLNGRSIFKVSNHYKDSVKVSIQNYYQIPKFQIQEFDTLVPPGGSVYFILITQGRSFFEFKMDSIIYKIFSSINSNYELVIESNSGNSFFKGDNAQVNNFLALDKGSFYSTNQDWIPYVNACYDQELNYYSLIEQHDNIYSEKLKEFDSNKNILPDTYMTWYKNLMLYTKVGSVLSSLALRKAMLNLEDSIPKGYLDSIVGDLPLENGNLLGSHRYNIFLHDYIIQSLYPKTDTFILDSSVDYKMRTLKFVDSILSEPFKSIYIAGYLTASIDFDKTNFKKQYLDFISQKDLKESVVKFYTKKELLPKGKLIPKLILKTTDSVDCNVDNLKDSLILINFWASYCKPCIKKFPEENKLVNLYKNQPVKIVNICIETDFKQFKRLAEKHQLNTLNLFADKKTTEKLKDDFEINGLPHSILIDKNLRVIQNKITLNNSKKLINSVLNQN